MPLYPATIILRCFLHYPKMSLPVIKPLHRHNVEITYDPFCKRWQLIYNRMICTESVWYLAMFLCGPIFTRSVSCNFQTGARHAVVYKNTIRNITMPEVIFQSSDELLMEVLNKQILLHLWKTLPKFEIYTR